MKILKWLFVGLVVACGAEGTEEDTSAPSDTDVPEDSALVPEGPPNYQSAEVCKDCHPRQYAEWRQSMHSYAAVSPVFEAMNAKAFRDSSGDVGTFCTGCHAPVGTAFGEGGHTSVAERSDISKEGVTCSYCHTAVDHTGPIGNNNILSDPDHIIQGPYSSDAMDGHVSEESSFIQTPQFCGSCHDVFSFPALRIEEAFTEYEESPAAQDGVRCQDCHMGPNPGVNAERPMGQSTEGLEGSYPDRELSSHFFVGPDYSMLPDWPYPGDAEANATAKEESLARTRKLLKNAVEIGFVQPHISPQETRIEVNLRSLLSGHGFPTGFTSERQAWLHIKVTDSRGVVTFESGDLDVYGDLRDDHSRAVREGVVDKDKYLINFQSKNLLRQGDLSALEVVETIFPFDADWIEKQNLGPLEEKSFMYIFDEPQRPFTVDVSLNYRNLPPYLLRALQLEDLVDQLEIFEIATESIVVP